MKKVIEYLNIFRKDLRVRKYFNDEIQKSISFIKYELQTFIKTHMSCKKGKENIFLLNRDGLKIFFTTT